MTLVDGGLVNPVPVSLARAMGADIVIAVDLGSDILGRHLNRAPRAAESDSTIGEWMRKLQENFGGLIPLHSADEPKLPSMHDVLFSSMKSWKYESPAAAWRANRRTSSWHRDWRTSTCSIFIAQKRQSMKASARPGRFLPAFTHSAISRHEYCERESNTAACSRVGSGDPTRLPGSRLNALA